MWLRRLNLGLETMARNGFHVVGATSVPSTRSRFLTGDDDAIERGELSSQPRVADGRVSRDMIRFGCSGGSVFS
jgi:hypothetical protein